MRKFLALTLALALIMILFAAPAHAAGDTIDLTLTGIGFNLQNGVDPATGEEFIGWEQFANTTFKEKFPNVNLKVETIPWDNFRSKMQTVLQSGGTDILYVSGSFTAAFYQEGLLENLTPFLEKDTTLVFDDVYPSGLRHNLNLTDYTGEQMIALPYILGYRIVMYDKLLFDQWGVEYLSEHPTIEEVIEKGSKMTGKNPVTGEQNYGIYFDGKTPNMATLLTVGYAKGVVGCEGTLNDLPGLKWSLDSAEMIDAVSKVAEAAKYCPPDFVNGTGIEAWGTPNNNIAIFINGTGSVIMNEYKKSGDVAYLDRFVPVANFGPKGEGWTVVDGIGMSSSIDEQKKDVAWEVIKYLAGPEGAKYFFDEFGPLAMAVKDQSFYDPNDKYIAMNNKMIENSHSSPLEELNPFFVSDIQPTIAGIFSRVASGETVDVAAALKDLQQKAVDWAMMQ